MWYSCILVLCSIILVSAAPVAELHTLDEYSVTPHMVDSLDSKDATISTEPILAPSLIETKASVTDKLYPGNGAAYNPYGAYTQTFEGKAANDISSIPLVPFAQRNPLQLQVLKKYMGVRKELEKVLAVEKALNGSSPTVAAIKSEIMDRWKTAEAEAAKEKLQEQKLAEFAGASAKPAAPKAAAFLHVHQQEADGTALSKLNKASVAHTQVNQNEIVKLAAEAAIREKAAATLETRARHAVILAKHAEELKNKAEQKLVQAEGKSQQKLQAKVMAKNNKMVSKKTVGVKAKVLAKQH